MHCGQTFLPESFKAKRQRARVITLCARYFHTPEGYKQRMARGFNSDTFLQNLGRLQKLGETKSKAG